MKTPYLDEEIKALEYLKKIGGLGVNREFALNEYKAIKKALTLK